MKNSSGNRRLIWHFYFGQLLVALAALLAVSWLAGSAARDFYVQQVEADLAARAHLLQAKVLDLLPPELPAAEDAAGWPGLLQEYCRQAGSASATRITVVAPDGRVWADSEQEPALMENHGRRPEIVAALAGARGRDVRFSSSVLYDTMYVALPVLRDEQVAAVLRTALPLTAIDRALAEITRRIALIGLLIALAVAVVAWFSARRLSRPLEIMRAGAESFAAGNLAQKIEEQGVEELAALARTMNRMAEQLAGRLQTIDCQRGQLEAVVGSMAEGVLTVDGRERLLDINRAAAELLDLQPRQVKGKGIDQVIRNSALKKMIRRTLNSDRPVEGEFTLVDGRSREHFCMARGSRLTLAGNGSGREPGAVLVISDLTRLRRLENLRRDFVANVSHELKTPITSIEGFAETLLEGALEQPEDARRFVAIIHKQSRRLSAIVEDLLTLSRIEQEGKRQAVPLQELPVLETLRAAARLCAAAAAEKEMELTVAGPEELRAWINPALLEQALVNLIDNAVKYSPPGRPVSIAAAARGDEVLLTVSDRGAGIPPESLPRIFERFYRVDKARSASLGGTGLGLAIVKHIVQAHGGRIEVSSTPGQGSVFTIYLPAREPAP